ncbi:MAG: response regulator [Immundisolibacteraceae bacterium]|nr:response regulator [Immundisolibacteraceae bacterium]
MQLDRVTRLQSQLSALLEWVAREHGDLTQSLAEITSLTANILQVDLVSVWLFDGPWRLVCRGRNVANQSDNEPLAELVCSDFPDYFEALRNKRILSFSDVDQAEELHQLAEPYYRPQRIVSILDVPVKVSGRLIGVICVDSLSRREWLEDEIEFAVSISTLVALAMETVERRAADKRLSEHQHELKQLLDRLVEGILTIETGGRISANNRAAEEILGYGVGELKGINVSTLVAGGQVVRGQDLVESLHQDYQLHSRQTHEQEVLRNDGEKIWIRLSVASLSNDEKGLPRFVCSFLDITEEKAQQKRLRRSQALDSMGQLTGGIAHDFNNMLGVILGYAELLGEQAQQTGDTAMASKIERIIHAGKRGSELTRRLLTFSRRSPGDPKTVNLNDLLISSKEMLSKTLTLRIALSLDCAGDLWTVSIDPGDFEDAILNLAVNTMHAIELQGSLVLKSRNCSLGVARAQELELVPGDYVTVTVIDDGIGMDEVTQSRVFDPFFTSRPEIGSGLGMSQVYGMIKSAGGGIAIESSPGKGTSIELYFPRCKDRAHTLAQPDLATGQQRSAEYPGGRVLIVEDEAALRDLEQTVLTEVGYSVEVAENGEQALALLDEQNFDLVLSDVIMPVMDGYRLVEILAEQCPTQNIKLVSGYEESVNSDRSGDLVVLRKPFDAFELVQAVNRAVA